MNFSGKVTVITGASSGIGRATAVHFASLGSTIVITGRNEDNLQETAKLCIQAGLDSGKIKAVSGDLCRLEDRQRLIESTIETFKSLDILVNNAGIAIDGPLATQSLDIIQMHIQTNLMAVMSLTQLAVPHLITAKVQVEVVLLGIAKTRGDSTSRGTSDSNSNICKYRISPAYCMTKAALDMFTKTLALELAPHQVRVNAVSPGCVNTGMHRAPFYTEEETDQILANAKLVHPLGRYAEPEEIAKVIAFLASDRSSFTHGDIFKVDGGRDL